ncbi:MAG: bifunctional adenosylcobinamide kinase/adenosylcobinamide-phosphate guanylyltransferase [Peptococcaceae bacterium]|nr:bifunctional adenosylcobinamide kinase/adenosylcobinamide-phosphate guanylyltransferase [Peptococcaceae bacterium]
MGKIVVVTGGARSGKSSFAEKLAAQAGPEVVYLATAQAFDAEMTLRIAKHRASRPQNWQTVEEPIAVARRIVDLNEKKRVILLDCVTVWLSNLVLQGWDEGEDASESLLAAIMAEVAKLIGVMQQGEAKLICVTNEVGWSIVPENALGRFYRDLAGKVNQLLAEAADEVYLVVAGCPLEIKSPARQIIARLEGC